LRKYARQFDCIVVDFPDPSNYAIAKLYTNAFYKELSSHLSPEGCAVIQCTSPFAARQSFWTIDTTIRSAGLNTIPYYNTVPSFGIWGYILCCKQSTYQIHRALPKGLKFYNDQQFAPMRNFSEDMLPNKPLAINKLSHQVLVPLFEEEWNKFMQ
jgi:spermidine synthase